MNGKLRLIPVAALALLALSLVSLANASPEPAYYLRSDRASYIPGDSGSLQITIRNQGDQAFTVRNFTITWPWFSFVNDHWDGNMTVNNINTALATGQAYNTAQSFTVPNDGRAYNSRSGTLKVGTDIGGNGGSFETSSFTIFVNIPTYTPVEVSTSIFSILLVGILGVATVLLFLVHQSLRRTRNPTGTTTSTTH